MSRKMRFFVVLGAVVVLVLAMAAIGHCGSSSDAPWSSTFDTLQGWFTGKWVKACAAIGIVLFGIGFVFSEGGGNWRKAFGLLFGISIALGAVNLVDTLFSSAGGMVF